MASRVLMMPLAASSAGVGHLRRSVRVAERLPGARLAVPASETAAAVSAMAELEIEFPLQDGTGGAGGYDVVVLDRRATSIIEMLSWTNGGLGVGIDEGGPARPYLPMLLDTVPRPERHVPNAASLRWALEPGAALGVQSKDAGLRRWLVTFGGDDPAHLSEKVAATLTQVAAPHTEVVVVAGPRFGERHWPSGVTVLPPQSSLSPLLASAALVCTAYGLTAYEALAGGTPVLLVNPTRYHQRLADASGIPSLGTAPWRRLHERRLANFVADPERLTGPIAAVQQLLNSAGLGNRTHADLSALLHSLHVSGPRCCPSCGRRLTPAVARFTDRTYRRCRRCRLIHMLRFETDESAAVSYDRSYFFEEYRQQYGRTYLEDFAQIRATGYQRLRQIGRCRRRNSGTAPLPWLLDVGCAFGPFLDAAQRRGWNAAGIDVSADAVAHVRQVLRMPAMEGSIEDLTATSVRTALGKQSVDRSRFDAITMWYVIEHLVELRRTLVLSRQLLAAGGVFAFSTPNASGISGRQSLRDFLRQSPSDHYTVWSPRAARQVLRQHGYRVRNIRVTGHHPERFPYAAGPGLMRAAYRQVAAAASRLFRLGDTFEVYATVLPQNKGWSDRR